MDRTSTSLRKPVVRNSIVGVALLLVGVYVWYNGLEEQVVEPIDSLTQQVPYGQEVAYTQLSTLGCRQTEAIRVCSHQANAQELRVYNGSLQAYQALWDQGIRCFDIDFMKTVDGFIVATHPQRLQDMIGSGIGDVRQTLKEHTIIMIRSLGASDEDFPITDLLFEHFAKMIRDTEPKPWLETKTQPNYRSAPAIFIDLKGEAFAKDSVWGVMKHAEKHGVTDYLALYALTPEQDFIMKKEGVWWGPKIRGYLDVVTLENGTKVHNEVKMREEDLGVYAMIGPSIKMDRQFFVDARATGKPIHSWVVDSPEELFYALEMQLDSIISNVPLRMQALLERWRQGCRGRFPRQKGWHLIE